MKRVLLTGASGFIGNRAIAQLAARGYEVHAVSLQASLKEHGVCWHQANLLDGVEIARVVSDVRPSHLLHFAWYAEHGKFWHSAENFRWLEAGIALLRHFREQGGKRVVMAGTCAEYDWNHGFCSETLTPCKPATPYGVCKNALQESLRSYSVQEGLSSAWGRIFFLYGPRENPARLVASVVNALLRGDVAQCTHGNQIRDFLHIDDVADAFVALLDSDVQGPVNIASGRPVSLRDVVLAAADCLGARSRVQFGAIPAPDNDPPLVVADVRHLSLALGWEPQFDLMSGIERTVAYWRERGVA